jgi:hypothetical protein
MHFLPANDRQRLLSVTRLQRFKASLAKHAGDRFAKIAIVIGDQQAWRREKGHGVRPPALAGKIGDYFLCNLNAGCGTAYKERMQTIGKAVLLSNVEKRAKSNVWKAVIEPAKLNPGPKEFSRICQNRPEFRPAFSRHSQST